MGIVREPKGIDFIVGPSMLTEKERKRISEIIAAYKKTGKVPAVSKRAKPVSRGRERVSARKRTAKSKL